MADIEKVIKGLTACTGSVNDCNENCPYFKEFDERVGGCRMEMERDALEILAEVKKGKELVDEYLNNLGISKKLIDT